MTPAGDLIEHLMTRLREVQKNFHLPVSDDPTIHLADALDSMGLVELVAILAEDFRVTPDSIDQAVGRKYGAIVEVAYRLRAAGFSPNIQNRSEETVRHGEKPAPEDASTGPDKEVRGWLVSTADHLPQAIQSATEINEIL